MAQENPMQPIVMDERGVVRFKANKIVRDLLDFASSRGLDLNEIGRRGNLYSVEDKEQLMQLIGYSVSGYGDLSYVRQGSVIRADTIAMGVIDEQALKTVERVITNRKE